MEMCYFSHQRYSLQKRGTPRSIGFFLLRGWWKQPLLCVLLVLGVGVFCAGCSQLSGLNSYSNATYCNLETLARAGKQFIEDGNSVRELAKMTSVKEMVRVFAKKGYISDNGPNDLVHDKWGGAVVLHVIEQPNEMVFRFISMAKPDLPEGRSPKHDLIVELHVERTTARCSITSGRKK